MKCSRRKAPMGTTPLMECRRRSRNEVPSPARSGATPDLIFGTGATGLAVDATMTAPYVVRSANWLLSFCVGREVKAVAQSFVGQFAKPQPQRARSHTKETQA